MQAKAAQPAGQKIVKLLITDLDAVDFRRACVVGTSHLIDDTVMGFRVGNIRNEAIDIFPEAGEINRGGLIDVFF